MEKDLEKPQKLNFFASAFVSVVGFSLVSEIFMENDLPDKIDDTLMVILAAISVYWYKKNALKKSAMPIALFVVAIAIKIMAIVIEMDDKEAVGDDFGVLAALIVGFIVVIYQYMKLKKK